MPPSVRRNGTPFPRGSADWTPTSVHCCKAHWQASLTRSGASCCSTPVTGLKHREIAALLELPLPTVLSKYHRALKKMRSFLEGDDAR